MREASRSGPILLFVTGTDTGVGKTVVTAGLTGCLRERGIAAAALKPTETGCGPDDRPQDGLMLRAAAGGNRPLDEVVPCRYREPLAPLVAARREGRPVDLERIRRAFERLCADADAVLVEGAGGLSVPLTDDLDMAGLAALFDLPVLVVGRPGLGTLNHTFLTVHYARGRGLDVVGVVFSESAPGGGGVAERTNPAMVEEMCGAAFLGTVPYSGDVRSADQAAAAVRAGIDVDRLLSILAGG